MTEGRRCQVHLLDDRKLELLVQVSHSFFPPLRLSKHPVCFTPVYRKRSTASSILITLELHEAQWCDTIMAHMNLLCTHWLLKCCTVKVFVFMISVSDFLSLVWEGKSSLLLWELITTSLVEEDSLCVSVRDREIRAQFSNLSLKSPFHFLCTKQFANDCTVTLLVDHHLSDRKKVLQATPGGTFLNMPKS